ncbi:MAG: putative protease, partial [Bradymonadia bacterium]
MLAPAGDLTSLRAGLATGADAVYFGLDEGFNARARAQNFSVEYLEETVSEIHRAGARAYVTLNTLVFEVELEALEYVVRRVAQSGVDAIIVQDPAVCLIAQRLCPELEIHASTQMTISSAEGARFAETLGVTRVVVPRELTVTEIGDFAAKTDMELEVFIHGALCVSWSGQCLSSEAWGGRSANRGKCAQACRLPYDLILDGEHKPLGDVRYLLSPKDLAGMRAIPALMEIGVHTLKIEGRLKGPAYVATAVTGVKGWVDVIEEGRADDKEAQDELGRRLGEMMVTYSRGFGDGFLAGADHQTLVEGRFPKHRGAYLGRIIEIVGNDVFVRAEERPIPEAEGEIASPLPELGGSADAASGAKVILPELARGMGIGFDTGNPHKNEPGGPLYGVELTDAGWRFTFGRQGPNMKAIQEGDRVWLTSAPAVSRAAEKLADGLAPDGRWTLNLTVSGALGAPLVVTATLANGKAHAEAKTESPLAAASGEGIDEGLIRSKLASFGGTPFALGLLDRDGLPSGLHLPVRELKQVRRALVAALEPQITHSGRLVTEEAALPALREKYGQVGVQESKTLFVPLVRTPEQLEAVIDAGCTDVELDWMELVGLGQAFDRARAAGLKVTVATVRVQKPGEEGFDKRIAKLQPDGVLIRHWGALMHFLEH